MWQDELAAEHGSVLHLGSGREGRRYTTASIALEVIYKNGRTVLNVVCHFSICLRDCDGLGGGYGARDAEDGQRIVMVDKMYPGPS
jgi:hypothetical protein